MNLRVQGLAFDKLHRDEVHAVSFTNFINVSDVGMVERRRGFCLLNETAHAILVCSKVSRQNLQSNFAIKFCVLRQINLTHPARADLRADFIAA